jgi:CubicO group peptidase (beta-lactamase class C family)
MRIAAVVLASLTLAVGGQNAPTIPTTPAGQQLSRWLDVFNRGQPQELQAFLEKNFPSRESRFRDELQFREMTGGFDLKKIETSEPERLTGILKEREGTNYARFLIEVDPAEPHAIRSLDLRVVPRPADIPGEPRLSQAAALDALKAEVARENAAGRFAGAVLVAKDGNALFEQACGLADREHNLPNRLDTRFRIGSMNKMFTAVAILQLAQAGKLKLTDPVGKYLTDYPNRDVATKVTIHHLLTHTGGTGDFFGPEFDEHRLELRTLQDYVKLYGQRGPAFEPGSRFAYSNYGFLLLGLVVEKVGGQDYYEYVRERVYKPAGMTRTDSLPESENVEGRAVGYTSIGGSPAPNMDTLPYRGTSAGGGYSTVGDMLAFANAVVTHRLLNEEYTNLLTTGKTDQGGGRRYAYGFVDTTEDGVRWIGHGGGAPGMNGDLRIAPESGYVIVALSNLDPPAAQRIADFIAARLPAK